jgi:hypothetical protein
MFPDRVGRFVLDGVVNSDDYNHNYGNGSIHDAEKAMASFYTFCLQSGPEECPLANSAASIEDLHTRVQNITKSLYHKPLSVPSIHGPEVLTYTDLQALFFVSLYSPPILFPRLAEILLAIETRDDQTLKHYPWYYQIEHVYQCRLNSTPSYDMDVPEFAVLCADGDDVSNGDIESFEEYWKEMTKTSPTMGPIWSLMRMRCMSWKIRYVPLYSLTHSSVVC